MSGPVTLTPTLNQANFGTGVFGTAKYGQYIVTLNDGVDASNSTSPEFGLTENFQYAAGQLDNSDGFSSTVRSQNVVLAGELTLPSSFSGDAECIWEQGGSGIGSWLGIAIINGVYHLRFRAGEGDSSVQDNTAGDIALANVAISNIPEFDGNTHTMVWEIKPGAAGRIRLWIDGRNIIDQETSGGAQLEGGRWAGSDVGGWGQGFSGIAGQTTSSGSGGTRTQNQAATAFSGTIQSNLRIYNNQLVGALTPLVQPNVTEVLTGVSATGIANSVVINAVAQISGVSATGVVNTVEPQITEKVSGVSATGQVGSVALSNTTTLSGVAGTTNTPSVEPKVTETIATGVGGTTQLGTVVVNLSFTLAGVSATGAVESVAVNGFEIDITERISAGVEATGQVGTVEPQITEKISGVSATGQIGTLEHSNTVSLSGVAGTTNTPSLEPKITEKISGVEGTGQVGTVRANPGAGLAGVNATGGVGTLEHSNTKTPDGVSATGAVGVVSPNIVEKISGVVGTGQVGSVRQNPGAGLTGVAGTGQIGTTTQTAIVFDFEAVRDQFSSKRMIYIPRAA